MPHKQGTWGILLREEVPKTAEILSVCVFLAIKDSNTEKEVGSTLLCTGTKDKLKTSLVHEASVVQP